MYTGLAPCVLGGGGPRRSGFRFCLKGEVIGEHVPMEQRVAFDLRGSGRLGGGYSIDAPFEVLLAGVEAAWTASDADGVQLTAAWPDDPDWDAQLRAAGWELEVPRRRRFLGITISHGALQGSAEASDRSSLRRLVVAANAGELPDRPHEIGVLLAAGEGGVAWTFTLYKDVLEVLLNGDDTIRNMQAVTPRLQEAATGAGLRLTERRPR